MIQNLSNYDNSPHSVGTSKIKYILWMITSALVFQNPLNFSSKLKVLLLKTFGAKIGVGVTFKPSVQIKYPWRLIVGSHCWIGEHVWIDNLDFVTIEDNVCISQGAMLLTGSHNHTSENFDFLSGPIYLETGVWIGAKAVIGKDVRCQTHAILGLLSVAERDLKAYTIYKGNPALPIRKREIRG